MIIKWLYLSILVNPYSSYRDYYTCSYGEIGCSHDEDCRPGLFCNKINGDEAAFCDNTYCNIFQANRFQSYTWYYYKGNSFHFFEGLRPTINTFLGQCITYVSSTKSWSSAQSFCKGRRADLVKIESFEDQERFIRLSGAELSTEFFRIFFRWDSIPRSWLWE